MNKLRFSKYSVYLDLYHEILHIVRSNKNQYHISETSYAPVAANTMMSDGIIFRNTDGLKNLRYE